CNEHTIRQADSRTDKKRCAHPKQNGRPVSAIDHDHGRNHADQRNIETQREIETTCQNDNGLSHRKDCEKTSLNNNVLYVTERPDTRLYNSEEQKRYNDCKRKNQTASMACDRPGSVNDWPGRRGIGYGHFLT